MTKVIHEKPNNFNEQVLNIDGEVLVDFYADWCSPCKALSPILYTLTQEKPKLSITKINADEAQSLMSEYGVRGFPTLRLFHKGQLVASKVGAAPLPELRKFVAQEIIF